jgi:hypothetical protein
MSYDQTDPAGGYQFSDDDRMTEAVGGRGSYPSPEPFVSQQPAGGYPQQPMDATRTVVSYREPAVLAWLAVVSGPRLGKLYRLSPEATNLGRESSNEVILDEGVVSRQHARVKCEKRPDGQHQFYLFDLATPNGTLVNGAQILKEALYDGDRIQIGSTSLVFKQIDGPQRPAPAVEDQASSVSSPEGGQP